MDYRDHSTHGTPSPRFPARVGTVRTPPPCPPETPEALPFDPDRALAAAGVATAFIGEGLPGAAIDIRAVSKCFGRARPALSDVSLTVAPGECMAVAGVNGAGKTTLLRCLLDFTRPDTGRISIHGTDSRRPEARRALAWLPERFLPSPHLTGRETLSMLAGLQDQHWCGPRIAAALAELEFPADALERRTRLYSKGMMQKLGLASAVLQDKPVLVLDEPMSGLDPLARRFLSGVLSRLRADGRTLIFTSHAPADIERLADRLALLHGGRLLFLGPPAQLREAHGTADLESAFVACIRAADAVGPDGPDAPLPSRSDPT